MFGQKKKQADTLPVTVQVVRSAEAFAEAAKLWNENARGVLVDNVSKKEVLHFSLVQPKTVMWVQRDINRQDEVELIISWQDDHAIMAEVFVILPGPEKAGDDGYVRQVLKGLMTTASTVPFNQLEGK
jgi:hypothetical protein